MALRNLHALIVFFPSSGLPAPAITIIGKINMIATAQYAPLNTLGLSPPICGQTRMAAIAYEHHKNPYFFSLILKPSR